MIKFTTIVMAVTALLSACSNTAVQPASQSVGKLPADTTSNYVAANDQAQTPVKIVKEYVPVAIPGQLMPVPTSATMPGTANPESDNKNQPVFLTAAAAVQYANKQALMTPQSEDFFNAMMTYQYMPGALYTIYTAPMKITDIAFAMNEKIVSIAAGDTLRWQISQTYSGQGSSLQQHILVKPNASGLQNTVVVTTSQRVYHLVLNATDNNTYMVAVSWNYPGKMVQFDDQNSPGASPADSGGSTTPFQLNLNSLDFNYQFGLAQGNKPDWYPERVFNNGRQTFIEFPQPILTGNAPLPMLFIANNNDHYGTMYNWRQKGRYMIVDGVIHNARLQSGVGKDSTIVQIEYTQTNE